MENTEENYIGNMMRNNKKRRLLFYRVDGSQVWSDLQAEQNNYFLPIIKSDSTFPVSQMEVMVQLK